MGYKITFSKKAISDIDIVGGNVFKACQDIKKTQDYINKLLDKIYSKSDFPESGTPFYFLGYKTKYRYVIYKHYMAFYTIEDDEIVVIRIVYGKSDYTSDLLNQIQ